MRVAGAAIPSRSSRLKLILTAAALALTAGICVTGTLAAADPASQPSIEQQRRYFTEDAVAPAIVPAKYDVTIVEYMDYQCPYCRATQGPLKRLLASDRKIRVIFRDWPIFGPASEAAARAAIASKYQGKYLAFHNALMEAPLPLSDSVIRAAAKKAGVDWARLERDKAAHSEEIADLLARNDKQAQMLGLQGTPGFIIGNTLTFGGMTLAHLRANVAKARTGYEVSLDKCGTVGRPLARQS